MKIHAARRYFRKEYGLAVLLGVLALNLGAVATAGRPSCFGRRATIVGTARGEIISGTSGNDVIVAGAGRDVIDGRGGADRICAERGRDFVYGRGGDDRIRAGDGNDYLAGALGDDLLDGGKGFDYADYATSGNGIVVDSTVDTAHGQGRDTIPRVEGVFGTEKADSMAGSGGTDDFYGDRGQDTLSGLGGDDLIAGGRGRDTLEGGDGALDIVLFFDAAGGVSVDLVANAVSGAERDSISGFEGAGGSREADVLRGTDAVNHFFGGYGDDEIYGLGGADRVNGGGNDDFMAGDAGDDRLDGGDGTDTADGGDGTDACLRSETTTNCESTTEAAGPAIAGERLLSAIRSLREAARGGRLQALRR